MNQTDQTIESELNSNVPLVPSSTPPGIESLNQRVASLRRRRSIVRGTATCVLLLATVFAMNSFRQPADLNRPGKDAIALSDNQPSLSTSQSDQSPTQTDRGAGVAPQAPETRTPKIQLYASLSHSVPVFDLDEETKTIHHVGWVESQQEVPVDMKYVPENQQESFNAVLNGDSTWHYSL